MNQHIVRKQGAWGLWWLVAITCGIYYFVWYHRIQAELHAFNGKTAPWYCRWYGLFVPFAGLVGLCTAAGQLNEAHTRAGSPTRVGGFTTIVANWWFWSDTRYLQRRINILHDVVASHAVRAGLPVAQQNGAPTAY